MGNRYKIDKQDHMSYNCIKIYDGTELIGKLVRTSPANAIWELECKRVEEMVRLANLGDSFESIKAAPIQVPLMWYFAIEQRPYLVSVVYADNKGENKRRGIINLNDIVTAAEYGSSPSGEPLTRVNIRGDSLDILTIVFGSPKQFLPQPIGQDIELDVDGVKEKFKVLTTKEKMI